MQRKNTLSRALLALTLLTLLCAGLFAPRVEVVEAAPNIQPYAICPSTVIALWDFTGDVVNPSTGSGIFSSGSGLSPATPPYTFFGGPTNSAISFSSWDASFDATDYIEFAVDTTGKQDIGISFLYKSTALSGPNTLELHYSDNGISFSLFGTTQSLIRDSAFHSVVFDLTSISTLNNNVNTKFRIYAYGASGGDLLIDDVSITEVCASPTATATNTATITLTPTNTPTCDISNTNAPSSLVINEVAWAGTISSTDDQWIELYNPVGGIGCVILTGWVLRSADNSVNISLSGQIDENEYYLLERADQNTISSINTSWVYPNTNVLSTSGEILYLENNTERIDTANIDGGEWPAGSTTNYRSMERLMKNGSVGADSPGNWITNTGILKNGFDSGLPAGCTPNVNCTTNPRDIWGTPGQPNWASFVTPTVTRTPVPTATRTRIPTSIPVGRPVINEFLARPGFDWNQDGKVDVFDEFIEVKNVAAVDVNLSGWVIDDEQNLGSDPFTLPSVTLKPGGRIAFYGLETNILLGDGGDTVRLLNPSGKIYDSYTYKIVKVEDQSVCRMPDGGATWYKDCVPTPNLLNTREGEVPVMPGEAFESPVCGLPDTLPEAFLIAECRSYGSNLWRAMFWDLTGWNGELFVPQNKSKWDTFAE